jgi:OmpA-OmpF porin, OOP family
MTAGVAAADDGAVDIQLFRPAVDSRGYFTRNASSVLDHKDISLGLMSNYALRPLELEAADGRKFFVDHLVTAHLAGAVGLWNFAEVGLGLPFTIWNGSVTPDSGEPGEQGIGDLALHTKFRILRVPVFPIGIGALLTFRFPTGSDHELMGEGQFIFEPTLIIDREFGRGLLRIAANVGGRFRPNERTFVDTSVPADTGTCPQDPGLSCGTDLQVVIPTSELTYGAGLAIGLVRRKLELVGEIYGSHADQGSSDLPLSPVEALGGFKVYLAERSFFAIGGGAGLNEDFGSPDARAFIGFTFEPSVGDRDRDGLTDDIDKCPSDPEDHDGWEDGDGCPEPDNDGDGIYDVNDKCPDEPEDFDRFKDTDGCPEVDNDKDGLVDTKDKCPNIPETFNSIDDEDGCPDADTDGDGFADNKDKCPLEPENFNGFQDTDGCPDSDRDSDRIADEMDKCPDQPETYNGVDDEDGCPDKGRVVVKRNKIEILDVIYFKTGKSEIDPRSFQLLNEIAATIQGNPQIGAVEVQGHADERGDADFNKRLTQARSDAVRDYLVGKGLESTRLSAIGYGEDQPVCNQHNEKCWKKNRRVEFVIVGATPQP